MSESLPIAAALTRELLGSGPTGEHVQPGLQNDDIDSVKLQEMLDLMEKIDVFTNIPHEELPRVAHAFTTRVVQDGEPIIRMGEHGDEMFFIEFGIVTVKVESDDFGNEVEIATLSHGEYFGETALLTEAPRNASVYAKGCVRLKVLTRTQFETLDLQCKLKLQLKYAKLNNGLGKMFRSLVSFRKIAKMAIAVSVYILLSCVVFSTFEGWTWGDSAYFSIVTLTTVGYGDRDPQHTFSKLFLMALVLLSLLIVAIAIGDFLEALVTAEIANEKARNLLRLQQPRRVGIFDQDSQKYAWKRKFLLNLLGMISLLCTGTLLTKCTMNKLWLDSLYFTFITLTTVGYGDLVPQDDDSKIFVSLLCFFGVPLFGMGLARVVDIAYGKARNDEIHHIVGGLTVEKFNSLIDFCDEMWRAGAYNTKPQESRRDEITPFEFMCFILTKNGTVSMQDIKAIMANFSELDTDGNGKLEQVDLEEWQRRGAVNPASLVRNSSMIPDHLQRRMLRAGI